MKTDRELIELAARAAGLTVMWSEPFKRYERFVLEKYVGPWDPLNDDGDALRLATALRISIIRDSLNMHAATRRAIVRAAVYIGEQL